MTAAAHKDLLGDDDESQAASPPLQDQSAEIGNVKNQLSSTSRSLETAVAERTHLERQLTEQAALLSSLQTQLSSAKAAYDTETKLLSALKDRFNAQSTEIQKTREELIRAESDLSAAKVEKAEVEGALLRDKEEVRDLHRKMHEVGSQIETTKADLEKFKKEAKQQKGLLAIAKKQLATREAEKAKVDKETEEAKAELQAATTEREAAEAEFNKEEPSAAAATNGHISPVPTGDSSVAFAATQPLPGSLPTSPDVSPPSTKSTNPFERLARTGSPRPESPFLPFAATSVLPTPPIAPAQTVVSEDPFGFNETFGEEPKVDVQEPGTPKPSVPAPIAIGSPHAQEIISPADTDLFTTPPTTATSPEHVITPQDQAHFPALDDVVTQDSTPTPTGPPTTTLANPQSQNHVDTDLMHELKEIEESDSDSSDESDDDEPLTSVKAKLADGANAKADGAADTSGTSAFDDSFGISSTSTEESSRPAASAAPTSTAANDFDSMFDTPTITREPPPTAPIPAVVDTPKTNGSALTPSAGVNEFDQALGKLPGAENSPSASQFTSSGFGGFDSAFDDNFDFAAASAAQPTQVPSEAPFVFPPAPTAAMTKSTSFDDVFGTTTGTAAPASVPALATSIPTFPPVTAPVPSSRSLSFEDAFGTGSANVVQNSAVSSSAQSSGMPGGLSFEDAFGGDDTALTLDSSFTSQSSTANQPPSGATATKTPFPTSSQPSSPRGSSSTQPGGRRSSSPISHTSPPRHASPPPRHSSPRPRPSTADSTKEKAAATRHNRLSVRTIG